MDINLEYYKIFYYTAKQKKCYVSGRKTVNLTAGSQPGDQAFREGSWLCIVCKNGKGSTSDQGG